MATQNYFKVKNGLEFPSQDVLQVTDAGAPSIKPTLNLDFAKTKSLDPRISYSRSTTATYFDGSTQSVGDQNLFMYSNTFDPAVWAYVNATNPASTNVAGTTAPDGTSTATKLVEGTFTDNLAYVRHLVYVYPSTTYCFSVYAKAAERSSIALSFTNYVRWPGRSGIEATFDLNTGTARISGAGPAYNADQRTEAMASFTYGMTSVGNGWYRCWISGAPNFEMVTYANLFVNNTGMSRSFNGFGTSGIYLWGAQLETGKSSPGTYVATTSTSIISSQFFGLQTASAGTARFDHDPITRESKGLLIEEQRTNLLPASTDVTNGQYWGQLGYAGTSLATAGNATVAPDGSNTATMLSFNSVANEAAWCSSPYTTVSSGTAQTTVSAYVKKGSTQYVYLFAQSSGSYNWRYGAKFDLVNSTYTLDGGVNANITAIGNGWYRIWVTGTVPNVNNARWGISPASSGSNWTTGTVYVWGPQMEVGTFATSYIPTKTTFVGRGSIASYLGSNNLISYSPIATPRYTASSIGTANTYVEGSAVNYAAYSEYPLKNTLTRISASQAQHILAPDGSMNATDVRGINQAFAYPGYPASGLTSGQAYTASVFIKKGAGANYAMLMFGDDQSATGVACAASINLNTGVVSSPTTVSSNFADLSSATSVVAYPNGWYRVSITKTLTTASGNAVFNVYIIHGTDWGQNVTTAENMYVWGAQIEKGSVATSYIPSTETFTSRSSIGTYVDSIGFIRTAPSGFPRYSCNPSYLAGQPKLLIEQQATNYLLYNVDAGSTYVYVNGGSASTAVTAPDGTTNNIMKLDSTSVATPNISSAFTFSSSGLTFITYSIYVKPYGSHDVVSLWIDKGDGTTGATVQFKLSTMQSLSMGVRGGTVIVDSGVKSMGSSGTGPSNWYRLHMTIAGTLPTAVQVRAYASQGNFGNNGDGYGSATGTAQSNSGVYLWGWQAEGSATATSFMPITNGSSTTRAADTTSSTTTTRYADVWTSSQVTRAADTVQMTGSNFSSWFNPTEHTFVAEAAQNSPTDYGRLLDVSLGNTNTQRYSMYRQSGVMTNGINSQIQITGDSWTTGTVAKIAFGASSTGISSGFNGNLRTNVATYNPYVADQLNIGRQVDGFGVWNGTIKRIQFYPKRLTNAEITTLSTQ